MKSLLIVLACLALATCVARAADAPKPTCGKTVEACQKAWDDDEKKLAELTAQLSHATSQAGTYRSLWLSLGDTVAK